MMTNLKIKKNIITIVSVALIASTTYLPTIANTQNNEQSNANGKAWFALLLLEPVKNALAQAVVTSFSGGFTCVMSNLFSFMGANQNPSCKPKTDPQTINNVANSGGFNTSATINNSVANFPVQNQNQQQQQQQQPVTTIQAEGLSTQPILAYVVKKLASNEPNANEIGDIANGQLEKGGNPSFTIRTGESFAIAFSTTVPGRVRIINTDVDQNVTPSSLYETIPAADNRLPRAHEGGILMAGKTGVEFLDVEFIPCIAQTYRQDPRVLPFVNLLNPCSTELATKSYKPAIGAAKGGVMDLGGKAMLFPVNANPTQPVAIAPTNYAKGDFLRFRIMIDHVAN